MNLYPVTVFDNFYEDPQKIRKFALAQDYIYCHELKNVDYVYPGSRTKDLSVLDPELYVKVCRKLMSTFHIQEYDALRLEIQTSFQIVGEKFGSGVIHQDNNVIFSGVLYLTPNAPLDSGTSLFKKNEKFDEMKFIKALADNDERFRANQSISYDYHDMFDEIVRINNIYNNLIVFEGDIPHCANRFFGTKNDDSRMAQVFFVKRIDANKESSFPLRRVRKNQI